MKNTMIEGGWIGRPFSMIDRRFYGRGTGRTSNRARVMVFASPSPRRVIVPP